MMKCCCFCGENITESSSYILMIQKDSGDSNSDLPTQELYSHQKCLEERLFQEKLLYLKYL